MTKVTGKDVKTDTWPNGSAWGVRTASLVDPGGHIWEIAH